MGTNASTKKVASKIIAVLLAALMLVSVLPMTAFAAPKENIVVDGLTVYLSGTDLPNVIEVVDVPDDDKDEDKSDNFTFDDFVIEVSYRSLDQIKIDGEKAPRAKEIIKGFDADLWGKFGLSSNYKEGQDLSVNDTKVPVDFYFGENKANVLETEIYVNVIPAIDTTWTSAKEVGDFTSDSDLLANTSLDLDDMNGRYLLVADGDTLIAGDLADLEDLVDAQAAYKSLKTYEGVVVNGKYINDLDSQFKKMEIADDKIETVIWQITSDSVVAVENPSGYEISFETSSGDVFDISYVSETDQIRDDEWPLKLGTDAVTWTLTDDGKLYTVVEYIDKTGTPVYDVLVKDYVFPTVKEEIYVAVAEEGYAYLTATKADAASIKVYRIEEIPAAVTDIEIAKNPDKMSYIEGQEFDIDGMEVNLMYNDMVVVTVPAALFDYYGITTVPADTTPLQVNKWNDRSVRVIYQYDTDMFRAKLPTNNGAEDVNYTDDTDVKLSVSKPGDKLTGELVQGGKLTDGVYAIVWVSDTDTDKLAAKTAYNGVALNSNVVEANKAALFFGKDGASSYKINTLGAQEVLVYDKAIATDLSNAQWIIKYNAEERAFTIQDKDSGKYLSRSTASYENMWCFDLNPGEDTTFDGNKTYEMTVEEYIALAKSTVLTTECTADSYWLIDGSFDAAIESPAEDDDNYYLLPFAGYMSFAVDSSSQKDIDMDNYYFFKLADYGIESIKVAEQPTLKYNSGDKLDLHALVIEATYTDGKQELIPFDEFNAYGLTVDLADKILSASNNGQKVVISLGDLKAETGALDITDTKADVKVNRLGGADRFETAKIIAENYVTALGDEYKNAAVLVSADQFPDALAGSTLAAAVKAPIVLTKAASLNAKTAEFLTENNVNTVYVLGGVNAIGEAVEASLKAMNINVIRVAGDDRIATSVEIAKQLAAVKEYSDTVIITTGYNFADALSVSSAAAKNGTPILYVNGQGAVEASVKDFIAAAGAKNAIILGGEAAVSASVEAELKALNLAVTRVAGNDRFETSVEIAKAFADSYTDGIVAMATATTFPDALAGGVYASQIGAPVVLVDNACANADAALYFAGLDLTNVVVFGGPEAVTDATVAAALLK